MCMCVRVWAPYLNNDESSDVFIVGFVVVLFRQLDKSRHRSFLASVFRHCVDRRTPHTQWKNDQLKPPYFSISVFSPRFIVTINNKQTNRKKLTREQVRRIYFRSILSLILSNFSHGFLISCSSSSSKNRIIEQKLDNQAIKRNEKIEYSIKSKKAIFASDLCLHVVIISLINESMNHGSE